MFFTKTYCLAIYFWGAFALASGPQHAAARWMRVWEVAHGPCPCLTRTGPPNPGDPEIDFDFFSIFFLSSKIYQVKKIIRYHIFFAIP